MVENDLSQEILMRVVKLRRELAGAADIFESSSPEARRSGVQIALAAIESFLVTTLGANDPKPLMPLRQLNYALHDLNRGKVVALLVPQKTSHRPPDSVAKEAFMAFAAACMELLVESGISRGSAARRVANDLNARGYRRTLNKRITAKYVEDWRDRMRSGSPSESEAVARFQRILILVKHRFSDPQTAANSILERISHVAPPEIPKKPPAKLEQHGG
jgi:hypothetical protein